MVFYVATCDIYTSAYVRDAYLDRVVVLRPEIFVIQNVLLSSVRREIRPVRDFKPYENETRRFYYDGKIDKNSRKTSFSTKLLRCCAELTTTTV